MKYKEYIISEEWSKKKKEFVKTLKNRNCQICRKNVKRLDQNIHHMHYNTLGNENPWDLLFVHRWCHEKIHFDENGLKTRLRKSSILKRVNRLRIENGLKKISSHFDEANGKNMKKFSRKKSRVDAMGNWKRSSDNKAKIYLLLDERSLKLKQKYINMPKRANVQFGQKPDDFKKRVEDFLMSFA